jgi:hypothetical protein
LDYLRLKKILVAVARPLPALEIASKLQEKKEQLWSGHMSTLTGNQAVIHPLLATSAPPTFIDNRAISCRCRTKGLVLRDRLEHMLAARALGLFAALGMTRCVTLETRLGDVIVQMARGSASSICCTRCGSERR